MDREYALNGLELNYDAIVNKKINAICRIQANSLVENRELNLGANNEATTAKLKRQTRFVCALQQTGTEIFVNLNRRVYNYPAQLVQAMLGQLFGDHSAPPASQRLCVE